PLCVDWGNYTEPNTRWEPWYHNGVSFVDAAPGRPPMRGEIVGVRTLPGFVELSHGRTEGQPGQVSERRILMVESIDPMGANYLLLRDHTAGAEKSFFNLFCLASPPRIQGDVVHFPGQLGVDLDVFVLSPQSPTIRTDHWAWRHHINTWGDFAE